MSTSSIDDLLLGGGGNSQQPDAPEYETQDGPEEVEELEESAPEEENTAPESEPEPENEPESNPRETDEYGNEQEPENEVIRDRLARQAKKYESEINTLRAQLAEQGASREVQKAAGEFEYDPSESGDWQQQLASFVKQTVSNMSREQEESQRRASEAETQVEFESKFRAGIEKFHDFVDVISALPFKIDNPMTLATRGMNDPAAFLYAAAKRHPAELERISKMRDPYAKMTEMGKLEERMKRTKSTTKAPRPLGRTPEDGNLTLKEKDKNPTIEQLIAAADAKKLNRVKGRRGGVRR